ncbi:MAG: winged helix-turn-helix domain-containing protein [Gammaproteobacteria bacterium]
MIFQFSGVELDTERFSIARDGQPVPVTPKVFDLLVFLIRHRDRVVTRDQLLDGVWSGRLVADGTLSNDIKLARAILGDDGVQQKHIKTIRGRGYKFVGDVREFDSAGHQSQSAAASANPRNILAKREPSVSAVDEGDCLRPNSIAVLPFENRSSREDDAHFTDGFHDELITHISKVKELTTISRTSVMAYRGSNKSMRDVGGELHAANIIEGSVQRAGDQVRINVQLIDAQKDEHIWAEIYTRKLTAENVFAIQSEIALTVADNLQAVLSPREQQDFVRTPTRNMAALEAYFRGRVSYGLATSEGFSSAIRHFEQAIDLDPEFAEAHAQLALALLEKVHFGGLPVADQNALAEPLITRALMLKPELGEAYEALGYLERIRGNLEAAEKAYQKALDLKPNNPTALRMFGFFKSWECEKHEQALLLLNKARLLDPQNHHTLTQLGQVLMGMARFDDSRTVLNAAIDAAPRYGPARQALGQLYSWNLYQHDAAIKFYRQALSLDSNVPWTVFFLGSEYEDLGELDKAEQFYERYLELIPDNALSHMVRLKLHRIHGDDKAERSVLEQIKEGRVVVDPWHDLLFLNGFDARYSYPELSVDLLEAVYPELTRAAPPSNGHDNLSKLEILYATLLHLCGKKEKAEKLTEKVLKLLPSTSRYRWRGIGLMDAWFFVAMGDIAGAMKALRAWRELGGCADLTKSRITSRSLFESAEFQMLNGEILAELDNQRSNLARMDAVGELSLER